MRTVLTTVVAAAALLLSACTEGSAAPPASPSTSAASPDPIGRYVALGDSYAAGPLIPMPGFSTYLPREIMGQDPGSAAVCS